MTKGKTKYRPTPKVVEETNPYRVSPEVADAASHVIAANSEDVGEATIFLDILGLK